MSAVQEFLESEWKENESAIAERERAAAKAKTLRDLREALDLTLRAVGDAKERMETTSQKMREDEPGLVPRAGCIVVWIPWYIAMQVLFEILFRRPPHVEFGLPMTIIACVLGWYTPEIVFTIRERLRVGAVRNQAHLDYDRLSKEVEQLRQQIKGIDAN